MIKIFILSLFLINCAHLSLIKDYPEFKTDLYVLKKTDNDVAYLTEHVYKINPNRLNQGFDLFATGRGFELIDYLNERGGLACLDKKGLAEIYRVIYNSYLEIKRLK